MDYNATIYEQCKKFLLERSDTLNLLYSRGIYKSSWMTESSNILVTYPRKQDLIKAPHQNIYEGADPILPRAIYLHVPFCTSICSYCAFARSATASNHPKIKAYLQALKLEVEQVKSLLGVEKILASSIFIGGGTPTLLELEELSYLFELIQANFNIEDSVEFTLEGSPETLTPEKLNLAKEYGVNRITMGVETFDELLLKRIRRAHSQKLIFQAISVIRNTGFNDFNIDFIRNLPGQTVSMLDRDIEMANLLEIPSVTSYEYIVKPKSIDYKNHVDQKSELKLSFDKSLLHLYSIEKFSELGYAHHNPLVDYFVKDPKHAFQHSLQKWQLHSELLGFGQGAYGYINQTQYINTESYQTYLSSCHSQKLPIEKSKQLDRSMNVRRQVLFALKSCLDLDIVDLNPPRDLLNKVQWLRELGVLSSDKGGLQLTRLGALFADWVMAFCGTIKEPPC